jgi:AcrR family transcriptional regulator
MKRTQDKKDHILASAEELFAEKGYEGTSIRDLASKAVINVAMVSYYFGSKEKLFEALIDDRVGYKKEEIDNVTKDKELSPSQKLDQVIDLYVDRVFHNIRFNIITQREVSLLQRTNLTNKIGDTFMANVNNIRKIIAEGQKKGVFKDNVDVDLVILSIVGTVTQSSASKFLNEKMLKTDLGNDKKKAALIERIKNHLKQLTLDHISK